MLKLALENPNLQPPAEVDYDYLRTITNDWEARIGKGGQATVFVGEDPVLNRMFAVKTISLTGIGYEKEVEVRWFAGKSHR